VPSKVAIPYRFVAAVVMAVELHDAKVHVPAVALYTYPDAADTYTTLLVPRATEYRAYVRRVA
jgi:hypothetical protein